MVSLFIDNGVGFVLSVVYFSPSIEQLVYNELKNHLCVYSSLLTNRLHDKAAEICWLIVEIAMLQMQNTSEYMNSIHSMHHSFYHVYW